MSTPLWDALAAYNRQQRASFHTPGHKGHASWLSAQSADTLDLTELPQTGSLYDGGDVIEEAERQAAESFGAALTLFSGGGCSLCIQTMLLLGAGAGSRVVMGRNAHKSAIHAAALLDITIDWLTAPTPENIEAALAAQPAAAVYLTSPDYYGRLADMAGAAAVCRRFGAALLVDNAHGSHLGAFGWHPLALGADMTADSAHKTLPVLTGGAYLHLARGGRFASLSRRTAKTAMALFGSTSPSFAVLASLDWAQNWWRTEGIAAYAALPERLRPLREAAADKGFAAVQPIGCDPVRLTLDMGGGDGQWAADWFRRRGCEPETADARYVVFIPTPFNTDEELERLHRAIAELPPERLPRRTRDSLFTASGGTPPVARLTPRQALLAAHEVLPAAQAAGRIAAETLAPCPPGVAAVAAGEEITSDMAAALSAEGFSEITVVRDLPAAEK